MVRVLGKLPLPDALDVRNWRLVLPLGCAAEVSAIG